MSTKEWDNSYKRRRYTDPVEREKIRSYQKEYFSRPEVVAAQKLYRARPDVKCRRNSKTHIHNIKKKYGDSVFVYDGSEDPNQLELWMYAMYSKKCVYCSAQAEHADHREPLAKGGKHTWDNLQPVCSMCNIAKHSMTEDTFLEWVARVYAATKGQGV